MSRLMIYKDNNSASTMVSNRFIDEYMKDANDAQLKIYLYLLRMFSAGQATSVSDLADKFNHTEKDVLRALKYWAKQGLISLDHDASGALSGIRLIDLNEETSSPASNQDAASRTTLLSTQVATMVPPIQAAVIKAEPVAADSEAAPKTYVKPSYSLDQLKEFKERKETDELLFIAQSYIGKPLTPSEIKTILFFTDELHFSVDLIDHLLQYCVDRGKKDFKYIEKVAISWAEQGVTTPKQAQKASSKYDKSVYAIMNGLGRTTAPTEAEMEYINRWTNEYGFTIDIIFEACERTVLATDKHRFEYAEGILSSWRKENVHHKADIKRIDELYQKRKASERKGGGSGNRFNQFTQNSYDFEALEKKLLRN